MKESALILPLAGDVDANRHTRRLHRDDRASMIVLSTVVEYLHGSAPETFDARGWPADLSNNA